VTWPLHGTAPWVGEHIGDNGQFLDRIKHGGVIEGHDLHVIDERLRVAELRHDEAPFAPDRRLNPSPRLPSAP
jgi:hypothetical protein